MTDDLDIGLLFGISDAVVFDVRDATAKGANARLGRDLGRVTTTAEDRGADYGVLVIRRAQHGVDRLSSWWAYLRSDDFAELHGARGRHLDAFPVRMTLADAVGLLRRAGYGDEPTAVVA